ncbi:MAG: 2-C-methyl-D-erythritol 4-phosphate cytidylyltransferase [Candidatus Omnitrophica bacterium]|nr:2-C-methyl-D-erythritol 4-phosphate cytidylyltransferase [Candidatus Omnitrophota bacterium]
MIKAIVLAGGYSTRIKLKTPKQLVSISGRPLLAHTLDVFERCKQIQKIILVANKKYINQSKALIKQRGYKKVEQVCKGGRTRQQSVFNALKKTRDCDYVLIHDGVRPFISREDIQEVLKAAKKFGAATCAVKAVDTIVEKKGAYMGKILPRRVLWRIQTPQAFKFDLIYKAHQSVRAKGFYGLSDDAQLIIKIGKKVKMVQGDYMNFKITTYADLELAKLMLKNK